VVLYVYSTTTQHKYSATMHTFACPHCLDGFMGKYPMLLAHARENSTITDFLIYIARNSHASHVRNVQGLHYLSSRCSMEINGCQKWQRQKSERNSELLISVCSRTLSQDCKYSCMLCFLLLQTQGPATTINKRLLQEASSLKWTIRD
jgi:hypothetical protein